MALDLSAYFQRIEYTGELKPTLVVLEALHLAHATHIPFENLDILLGRPIRIDLDSVQGKLVQDRRGGYCFEHNLLFATVLEEVGFSVMRLAARVHHWSGQSLPRTHMTLIVEADGGKWLTDVGFGAEGLLRPVPFGTGQPSEQFLWKYRVVEKAGLWTLQSLREESWKDLYTFTLEPQQMIDYEMANYFTSTHPSSRFVQTLTAQRTLPDVRTALRNRELIVDKGATITKRVIVSDEELLEILSEMFGLQFPPGTRFRFSERS